jgi:hypothetical protein
MNASDGLLGWGNRDGASNPKPGQSLVAVATHGDGGLGSTVRAKRGEYSGARSAGTKVEKRKPRELLSDTSPFSGENLHELFKSHVLGKKMLSKAEIEELTRLLNAYRETRPSKAEIEELAHRLNAYSETRPADAEIEELTRALNVSRLKMPADAELKELARVLNGWHEHYRVDQTYRALNQTRKQARDALATLKHSCANLRKDTRRHVASAIEDAAPDWVHKTLGRRLDEIGAIEKFLATAENYSVIADLDSLVGEHWLTVAGALIEDFHNAMSPANPQLKFGLSHNGPLARFFAAIVLFLTGEYPTPGSVATQLKARKRGI